MSEAHIVPPIYPLLAAWRYVEFSVLRMIAGWGRSASAWEDKLAVCHHVWLQAQVTAALRERLDAFPGGKPDAPVHRAYEHLTNAVLLAPSFADAMAGVHGVLRPALDEAHRHYAAGAHPVHDLPTLEMLEQIRRLQQAQSGWYESFRARHPQRIHAAYARRIEEALAACGFLRKAIAGSTPHAKPCGVGVDFTMPLVPGRLGTWEQAPNIMPHMQIDWSTRVEARRLFFMIGYMWEMGVAEDQLRWIYSADFMPFEFIYAEARHMWDESRHGDSGRTRLADFGIDIADVGYTSYGKHGEGTLGAMSPRELYEDFYFITQLAETGYFGTKRYCFEDFAACDDDVSAEMMQFDIIDETAHVEYGRRWLEAVAAHAGVHESYRDRGVAERRRRRLESDARVSALRLYRNTGALPPDFGREQAFLGPYESLRDPKTTAHYEHLLRVVRAGCPLRHEERLPVRPNLPM